MDKRKLLRKVAAFAGALPYDAMIDSLNRRMLIQDDYDHTPVSQTVRIPCRYAFFANLDPDEVKEYFINSLVKNLNDRQPDDKSKFYVSDYAAPTTWTKGHVTFVRTR